MVCGAPLVAMVPVDHSCGSQAAALSDRLSLRPLLPEELPQRMQLERAAASGAAAICLGWCAARRVGACLLGCTRDWPALKCAVRACIMWSSYV